MDETVKPLVEEKIRVESRQLPLPTDDNYSCRTVAFRCSSSPTTRNHGEAGVAVPVLGAD